MCIRDSSFVTFKIDLAAKPSATMSDIPPFNLNNGHIPIDCILTVTERSSGESEVICLGGDCKTETVGVQQGVWMAPNADFVPIYSQSKCLTLKTYDRIGRAVQYSSVSGGRAGSVQSDRAVVDTQEAFSGLDLGVHRTTTQFLETTKEVVANGLSNEALSARTEFSSDRYDCVMECESSDIAERLCDFSAGLSDFLARRPHQDVQLQQPRLVLSA